MNSDAPLPGDPPSAALSLLAAVRRQWLVVVLVAAVVLGAAVFVTVGQARVYEATATVHFDPAVPRPLGDQTRGVLVADGSSYWNNKEYYKTQRQLVQSMRTATEVVRQMGLDKDPAFLSQISPAMRAQGSVVDAVAQVLLDHLVADQTRDSRLMTVRYRDTDPERARRILTALVDTYVQQNLDEVFESATLAADWLRSQLGTLRSGLEASEMALHEFKKSKSILSVSLDDQSNMLREEMKQLNQSLAEVRVKREKTVARVQALRALTGDDPSNLPALELIESPVLQKLRTSYVEALTKVDSLRGQGKGDNHPEFRAAYAAFENSRAALLAEAKNIRLAFDGELSSIEREIAGLQSLYGQAEKRAFGLGLLEIEYNRLRRAKDNDERLFSLVVERSKETDLTRMLRVNNIRVVDRPLRPDKPVVPNVPLNLAAGLMGGVFLGLMVAVARDQRDRTIKSSDDIDRWLQLPFLGLLPEQEAPAPQRRRERRGKQGRVPPGAAKQGPELAVHREPSSGAAEAARALRTNIVFMSPDTPFRTLLITSAGPAEGKTTVACAIAISMAQTGQRVVLVDCDLRRPRLGRLFLDGDVQDGVTTAMINPDANCTRPCQVPNLWIAPSGPLPPNPAELLQSDAFLQLLERLKQQFDRVIIDSPPIVAVTDAAVLSTRVDGTILVIRASKTTRDLARNGARALKDVGGRFVGVVLNAVELGRRRYGAYHYYYRRYEPDPTAPRTEEASQFGRQ
jgi:succinoglycan biosynthesis transport protein ExoP